MKKALSIFLVLSMLAAVLLVGCTPVDNNGDKDNQGVNDDPNNQQDDGNDSPNGDDQNKPDDEKDNQEDLVTIKVGASITPHAEILGAVKDLMKEQGYDLQIIEFEDYVLPNLSLENGEIDANYFQHKPYLDDFNIENNTHLVAVAAVHYEPFGIYPGKSSTLDLAEGATIAIPNDGTNEARALLLLQDQGLIKLKDDITFTATVLDIEENPLKLDIQEIAAAQIPRSLPDVDLAVINGNYAIQAGLSASKDALATESKDSLATETYANVLVVKEGHEKDAGILALSEALQSETTRKFMEDTYGGGVVPIF